jgi:hypothetical protein
MTYHLKGDRRCTQLSWAEASTQHRLTRGLFALPIVSNL